MKYLRNQKEIYLKEHVTHKILHIKLNSFVRQCPRFQRSRSLQLFVRASQGDGWPSAANNSAIVKHTPYHPAGPWLDHTNYGQVDDFTINILCFMINSLFLTIDCAI